MDHTLTDKAPDDAIWRTDTKMMSLTLTSHKCVLYQGMTALTPPRQAHHVAVLVGVVGRGSAPTPVS